MSGRIAGAVSETRLRTDMERNGEFGSLPDADGGRTVLPGTAANAAAREYLLDRLDDAGLDTRVDGVGNVLGLWRPPGCDADASPVVSGSHLDTVPCGGLFDGSLGVYAALEAIRAMTDAGFAPSRPVGVVCFTEEEGHRFTDGLLGSSVAAGARTVDDALAASDGTTTLGAALSEIGFRGEGRLDAAEWEAFLELHVEQGRRLERAAVPVGVVTSIAGTARCTVTVAGRANHAGTTPMDDRTDALPAASELVLAVESAVEEVVASDSATAVATVGQCEVSPGAVNVIPGSVRLRADVRDVHRDSIETVVGRLRDAIDRVTTERGVDVRFERPYDVPPTPMSDRCRGAIAAAGDAVGVPTLDLHSGAGHDAMRLAEVTDVGMLFAPSRDGASHSPDEWTDWADCAAATRVLATALADLAS
jgi:N-carbamoyl-L-amino-acid hydrolase